MIDIIDIELLACCMFELRGHAWSTPFPIHFFCTRCMHACLFKTLFPQHWGGTFVEGGHSFHQFSSCQDCNQTSTFQPNHIPLKPQKRPHCSLLQNPSPCFLWIFQPSKWLNPFLEIYLRGMDSSRGSGGEMDWRKNSRWTYLLLESQKHLGEV